VSHKGKIGRLPLAIREEINRRLLEGQTGAKILPWLNSLDEVKAVLEEDFEGLSVNDENLSQWRKGGYALWLRRREQLEHTRELAAVSVRLAKAGGGSLAEGAAAILAGKVLDVLEKLEELIGVTDGEGDEKARLTLIAESIDSLTLAVTRLRKGDHTAENLRLLRDRLAQTGEALELEKQKFRRTTCELFLKWRDDDRARNIADGPGTSDEKIEKLGQAMFGDLWK
jgi:hypothetical protein